MGASSGHLQTAFFPSVAPAAQQDPRLLVVLSSLCAEGTPVLALELCRRWKATGISPFVATLTDEPRDLESEFLDSGIPIGRIELPQSGIGRFFQLTRAVYRLCRELRPAAVLSMPLGWHTFMFIGARAAGVKATAAHVGNYPPVQLGLEMQKFRLLVQLGRPVTNTLICCSKYIQEGVNEHFGVPLSETDVIYNGVDVAELSRRASGAARARTETDAFVVGMVARLEIHKDHPTLIRAASRLQGAGKRFEIWLIGEGTRRLEYERLIADLGVGQTVRLLGMRRDVPELLGRMDAFVFSTTPDEGQGVALVEAMAAGVPIVATDVGACREVLKDGFYGALVPAGDPVALADQITMIAQRREDDFQRRVAGKKRVAELFSIEEMAKRYARSLGLEQLTDRKNDRQNDRQDERQDHRPDRQPLGQVTRRRVV